MSPARELTGWKRFCHLKLRFGLSKLPLVPARYRLCTPGFPDAFFHWTRVMPFMDPVKGAFDFELYGWDVRELRFLRRFLKPGMTFVDIGAHHGLYAVLASRLVGSAGRVIAFEPSPDAMRRLRWHVRLNNGAANTALHACAVGASASSATLFVPTRGVDTTSSLRPVNAAAIGWREVSVPVVSLEAQLSADAPAGPDLIKLDVEGSEMAVLEGSGRILANARAIWLFEALDGPAAAFGGSARALADRFIDLGHELFEFTPEGYLQPHRLCSHYPHDSNCNLLAVPRPRRPYVESLFAR